MIQFNQFHSVSVSFRIRFLANTGRSISCSVELESQLYIFQLSLFHPVYAEFLIDHFPIKRKQMSSDGNTSYSSITFVAAIEDGGQYLTCRAENTELPSSSMEDSWKLDVHCMYHSIKANFDQIQQKESHVMKRKINNNLN